MKIAVVVQRFGKEIVGGAESHAHEISCKLANYYKKPVDILTTTAKSYQTWENEYPEGVEIEDNLIIRRFNSQFQRASWFPFYSRFMWLTHRKFRNYKVLHPVLKKLEALWFIAQGPYCPKLISYLKKYHNQYDRVIFFTYLYYPTIKGIDFLKKKSVLVPTAHDENPFYFLTIDDVLQKTDSIISNSYPEKEIIVKRSPSVKQKTNIIGLGFNTFEKKNLKEQKYFKITYLGRISRGKGVDLLIQWLENLQRKSQIPKKFILHLAGHKESDIKIPTNSCVKYHGYVTSKEKNDLIASSSLVVNFSPLESLSMVTLEAMALGVPVLVNGNCNVFRYYAKKTTTVFSFFDEKSFQSKLLEIMNTSFEEKFWLDNLENTSSWVKEHYSWNSVLNSYHRILSQKNLNT